jgi:hypothetical protein
LSDTEFLALYQQSPPILCDLAFQIGLEDMAAGVPERTVDDLVRELKARYEAWLEGAS